MRNITIENYLKVKRKRFDKSILYSIESNMENAKKEQNEEQANYYWYLNQVYLIQKTYVNAFNSLIKEKYEEAWLELDRADIAIGYLENNTPFGIDSKDFNIDFIGNMIKNFQKLFPYFIFLSRESIIKEEKCSICGRIIKLRNHCDHIPGKVYMGELCLREITDMQIKAFALVTDPFDKYAMLTPQDKKYNYGMLKFLLENIHDPFEEFNITTEKRKKEEYNKVSRNDLCPCGSGKKYKKCHLGSKDELFDHFIVSVGKKMSKKMSEIRYFNTWID